MAWDPLSAYFENIIIHSPVTLQGSGGGGLYKDNNGNTVAVPGSTIDGRFYNANTSAPATTSAKGRMKSPAMPEMSAIGT